MSEFRSDLVLPSVLDSDPAVIHKLADLIASSVDFELPAAGIDHDPRYNLGHGYIHSMHQDLVLAAASLITPQIDYDSSFSKVMPIKYGSTTSLHNDRMDHIFTETAQRMVFRLHTADPINGADVTVVNAGVSSGNEAADVNLFDDEGHPGLLAQLFYKYDKNTYININDDVYLMINAGSYDPIYSEPEIYKYVQNPLSSILFRSRTSMGPATPHGFRAHIQGHPRPVMVSELEIRGQYGEVLESN